MELNEIKDTRDLEIYVTLRAANDPRLPERGPLGSKQNLRRVIKYHQLYCEHHAKTIKQLRALYHTSRS